MSTYEVITYVRNEHARGTALDEIRRNLRDNGWSEVDVNIAIAASGDHIRLRKHQVLDDSDDVVTSSKYLVWSTVILILAGFILASYLVFAHFYKVTVEPRNPPAKSKITLMQELIGTDNSTN